MTRRVGDPNENPQPVDLRPLRCPGRKVAVRGASPSSAFIDRALYLPKSWTQDSDWCAAAGVPEEVEFATKPALAAAMSTRAVEASVPAGWVAGDDVYGADPRLRATIRGHGPGYLLQVVPNRRVPPRATDPGRPRCRPSHRYYAWAWITIHPEGGPSKDTGQHHALIRRNETTGGLAYNRCHSLRPVPLSTLVKVAGQRWRIEEFFQAAKT